MFQIVTLHWKLLQLDCSDLSLQFDRGCHIWIIYSCPEATTRHAPCSWPMRARTLFLERETPDFIPPTLWPLNSPDLNHVDYSIWSVLQEKVYHSRITDLEELKTRLIDEWHSLTSRSLMLLSASGAVVCMLVSVHAGHISSINSDNVEPICRGTNCFLK